MSRSSRGFFLLVLTNGFKSNPSLAVILSLSWAWTGFGCASSWSCDLCGLAPDYTSLRASEALAAILGCIRGMLSHA
jgi:hypothetical protein